jgi:hypothetical protein
MSLVYIHLILNHIPVVGLVFTALILAIALARRSTELTKVALFFMALIGAISVVVYLTGEPAEELVEDLAGISETALERHEDIALFATVGAAGAGALALLALAWLKRRIVPRWVTGSSLVVTLAVLAVMGFTANTGGQIRHSEIRTVDAATGAVVPEDGQPPRQGDR